MKSFIATISLLLALLLGANTALALSPDSYNVNGPDSKEYIGDGDISLTWNEDKIVDLITLQNYEKKDILSVHAWKVRSDEPILDGYYNLSDHYVDWVLRSHMDNGGKYRLRLTGPDDVDFYSDWFIALYGESDEISDELELYIKPSTVTDGKEMTIHFNDTGADYYKITADCAEGVAVSGKARPNLCVSPEKVYPSWVTDKGTFAVGDFYPTTDQTASFSIKVTAYGSDEVVNTDSETVKIEVATSDDDTEETIDVPADSDRKTLLLNLIGSVLDKNSDVYKILSVLIQLGIIK